MPASLPLYCLIYRSYATPALREDDLPALLRAARRHNQQANLSGLLLYNDGQFLQVLEGPEPALSDLYARILTDARHEDVTTLAYSSVLKRAFPDWRMAYAPANPALLTQVTGFLPLADAPGLTPHPPADLRQLLHDFAQGVAQDA